MRQCILDNIFVHKICLENLQKTWFLTKLKNICSQQGGEIIFIEAWKHWLWSFFIELFWSFSFMSCGGTELSYAFRTCCSAFSQIWAKMCFKPDFRFEFEMFGQSSGVVFLFGFQNASALMHVPVDQIESRIIHRNLLGLPSGDMLEIRPHCYFGPQNKGGGRISRKPDFQKNFACGGPENLHF